MKLSPRTQRYLSIEKTVYTVLLLALVAVIAWSSTHYSLQADLTFGGRNTLTEPSRKLMVQMEDDIQITAFISRDIAAVQDGVRDLVNRYKRYKKNISLEFINPQIQPAEARALGITHANEVLIRYRNREQRLQTLSETTLSNALHRLARNDIFHIVFLSGHGERNPHGQANHDLAVFSQHLRNKGYEVQTLNLISHPMIPDNTRILVIADPRIALLAGEYLLIQDYLGKGGNLLWLHEPSHPAPLHTLSARLGITFMPGTIVDANAQELNLQADFALASEYPSHPLTGDLRNLTLFPQAAGIQHMGNTTAFDYAVLLQTSPNSWTETGTISGKIRFDPNTEEQAGPIVLGISLTKNEQRIIVTGDTDFLSNTYLGNGGNLELGLRMVDWLSHEDKLLAIQPISAPDAQLQFKDRSLILLAVFFLVILPALLVTSGIVIAWKRRRQSGE